MNNMDLIAQWKEEEKIAYIHGWDFSHIDGRCLEETDFPWEYRQRIKQYLTPGSKLLDLDTGGGEFLLSLGHPHENTAATEGYPPNVVLCQKELLPLGIDFRAADANGVFPFPDESFDVVINRHGDLNPKEIFRVLKKGGVFITQQVGADNDREFVKLLCGDVPRPFPEARCAISREKFQQAGFEIVEADECFREMRFLDVGALVWFARILPWEFPDFSVDGNLERLLQVQNLLEAEGCIKGSTHRYLLIAKK